MNHDIPWGAAPDASSNNSPTANTIRWNLVLRTRRAIEQGTYDTPEKFDAALDSLYDELVAESGLG